jgi:signal recognition particle subunit SRP54
MRSLTRIARGAGVDAEYVRELLKQYDLLKKLSKQLKKRKDLLKKLGEGFNVQDLQAP